MENEVINTLQDGEPVTSTYADIYFDDEYCNYKQLISDSAKEHAEVKIKKCLKENEGSWVSPSDQLIGIIDLKPPFTSKITRGKAHEGLLAIGNDILTVERTKFMKYLTNLLHENDCAWNHILDHEKAAVARKVKEIYDKKLVHKSKIMTQEIMKFYEETLRNMEINLKTQVKDVLISSHARMVSQLNTDIKGKLQKEKKVLENVLKKRYDSEVAKLKKYYRLLLNNEKFRSRQYINRTIVERNDAVQAFMRQIEAENISSTMYVLSTERKKCKIKQFIMENYQSQELKEKYEKLKRRQDIINIYKNRETHMTEINSEWETKIKKILQLFLKFISFSSKLLPEQSTFLLNFEKMVILQLNEIQKVPHKTSSILIDTETLDDNFKFKEIKEKKSECIKEPFIIEGGYLSGTPSTQYGSRETLPDNADLPVVRVQRQFVYAKCHHYEQIKARLEAERCKCMDVQTLKPPPEPEPRKTINEKVVQKSEEPSVSESIESLFMEEIYRLDSCPVKNCQDWINKSPFPYLTEYLDFDDKKFERVVAILGNLKDKKKMTKFIEPKDIVYKELPFGPTKEPYHTVETQYSSDENLVPDVTCPCVNDYFPQKQPSTYRLQETPSKLLMHNMTKRKTSMRRLLQQNPKLMKALTDESFDLLL